MSYTASWLGTFCEGNLTRQTNVIDNYFSWAETLDSLWGGLAFFNPTRTNVTSHCGGTWSLDITYIYQGGRTNTSFTNAISSLTSAIAPTS